MNDINLNIEGLLQRAMSDALRTCSHSYSGVANRMNSALATDEKLVTDRKIVSWLSRSAVQTMPAEYMPAFCYAVGSNEPLKVLANALGFELLSLQAQLSEQIEKLNERIKATEEERLSVLASLGVNDGQ